MNWNEDGRNQEQTKVSESWFILVQYHSETKEDLKWESVTAVDRIMNTISEMTDRAHLPMQSSY